jgi:hypothetical protein
MPGHMGMASSILRQVRLFVQTVGRVGHTLCSKSTSCDAVSNFFESRIHIEHLGWDGLWFIRKCDMFLRSERANLRVIAAFEERRDTDKPDIVVPHDRVFFFFSWKSECILEN